jgi:hypothetical protein
MSYRDLIQAQKWHRAVKWPAFAFPYYGQWFYIASDEKAQEKNGSRTLEEDAYVRRDKIKG